MIKEIKMDDVVEVAKYAYELNRIPQHNCKSFSLEYEEILESFTKDIEKKNDYLLGYYVDDKLSGVVSLCATPEEKHVQTTGGFFAKDNYQEVSQKFFDYIKDKFKGYYFYAAFSQENKEAIKFCEKQKFACCSRAYFLRITKENFRPAHVDSKIELLSEKYYDQYRELHNFLAEDAYWNSEKIITGDRFDVYIAINNDEVIGEFTVTKRVPEGEVYFLGLKEGTPKSVMDDLVTYATTERLEKGVNTMAYVECDSIDELNTYFKHGYLISETSIAFEADEL